MIEIKIHCPADVSEATDFARLLSIFNPLLCFEFIAFRKFQHVFEYSGRRRANESMRMRQQRAEN
jgi:hypothetical protein